jgi:hypothetical protein
METGFIRDRGDSDINHQSEWIAGEPQKRNRWIGGVKLGRARRYAVTTQRCESCGFLAAYATTPLNDVQPE